MSSETYLINLLCEKVKQSDIVTDQIKAEFMKLTERGRSVWAIPNPLSLAIQLNKKEFVRFMIQDVGFNINFVTNSLNHDWCGLSTSVQKRHLELAKYLVIELKADPNIMRKEAPYTLITYFIQQDDEYCLNFLVQELGANINIPIKVSLRRPVFLPLHSAMERDLMHDNTNWPMTKAVLDLGGNYGFETSWKILKTSISLGRGNFRGSAYELVSKRKVLFDLTKKMGILHLDILTRYMIPKKDRQQSSVLLQSCKCKDTLIKELISAVIFRDPEKIKSVLENGIVKINDVTLTNETIKSPILLLAVHNEDMIMTKILVNDFHADVNAEIVNGRSSTVLHYAIWRAKLRSEYLFLKNFVNLPEIDDEKRGWIHIQNEFVYASPLEAVTYLGWEKTQPSKIIVDLLMQKVSDHKKKLETTELLKSLKADYTAFKTLKAVIQKSTEALNEKLQKAEILCKLVLDCETDKNFLSQKCISDEQKIISELIERATNIYKKMTLIQHNPNYLNSSQIRILEKNLHSSKQAMICGNSDTFFRDLECVICQSFAQEHSGTIHIFSCTNDHLLCSPCLTKVVDCPLCKENFNVTKPTRNQLAERLVTQLHRKTHHLTNIQEIDKCSAESKISELGDNLYETVQQVAATMSNLEQKLKAAKALQEEEENLMQSKEYLTVEDAERKKRESETKLEKANQLHKKIQEVKESPDFLTKEEIVSIKEELKNILLE